MKKYFFILTICFFCFNSCKKETKKTNLLPITSQSNSEENISYTAVINFKEKLFNFGTIKQGDIVEHKFVFTNTGQSVLKITSVKGSSAAILIKDLSTKIINPKEKASFIVVFNSKNKLNKQRKSITITSNSKKQMVKIVANVLK